MHLVWFTAGAAIGATIAVLYAARKRGKRNAALSFTRRLEKAARRLPMPSGDLADKAKDLFDKGRHMADEAADLNERGR